MTSTWTLRKQRQLPNFKFSKNSLKGKKKNPLRSGDRGIGGGRVLLTWQCVTVIVPVTASGQRVVKVVGMMEAVGPVCLQVSLAPVGVGGVFAVASRAGGGQRGVVGPVQEHGVGLASGRRAADQQGVLSAPQAVGGAGADG